MSLLLDARRKSQQAQFAQGDGRVSQDFKLSLDEYQGTYTPELDDQPTENARSAGQNLFAAKLAMPPTNHPGARRYLLFALGGTILLLGIGVAYLWYIDSTSSTAPLRTDSAPPSGAFVQPVVAVTEVAPTNALVPGISEPGHVGSQKNQVATTAHVDSARSLQQDDVTAGETASRSTRPPTKKPFAMQPKEGKQVVGNQGQQPLPQSQENVPISIGQRQTGQVDPLLSDAYLAYRSGKLVEARQLYLAMLEKDARNPDVLLGLATIAQQHGENLMAAQYFLRVLALDPRNASANAGMSALSTGDDVSESRLKTLLREQGNSAVLHFALGNLYAEQLRWSDAQQAYFNAYTLEPGNAGFAFNLAVSLDHLGQNKLAVQHYQRALHLDQAQSAGLNRTQISQRIEKLDRHGNAD